MSGFGNSPAKFFIRFTVSGIEPIITCHLEMLFRYVLDKRGNKVHYRNCFLHRNYFHAYCNERPRFRVTEVGLGIDIEIVFIFFVNVRFALCKRKIDM